MNARILAFDTGTANTGYSLLAGTVGGSVALTNFGMVRTKKTQNGSEDVRARIDRIGEDVRKLVLELAPTHIAIEDFTEQGTYVGKTYKEMAWLTEHFRVTGRELGYSVSIYENGYWKKTLMKARRANKMQVQHFISHTLPEAPGLLKRQPNHVWDSVGIGLCAWKELHEN